MVTIVWRSPTEGTWGREALGPWAFLLLRWLAASSAPAEWRRRSQVLSLLASPKCHKVGRIQLYRRWLVRSVRATLPTSRPAWAAGPLLFRELRPLAAWLGHGCLQPHELRLLVPVRVSLHVVGLALAACMLAYWAAWLEAAGHFLLLFIVCLGAFAQVMFFTVLERKFLALMQRRTGPRVVGVRGRLQCLADALKLLVKLLLGPRRVSAAAFQGAALGGFWLSWLNFGNITYAPGLDTGEVEYNIFYAVASSAAFSIMWLLAGWASASKYALLGCLRAAVQLIAFESIMGLAFLVIFTLYGAFNYEVCVGLQRPLALALCQLPLALALLAAFFVETNRPPFDLSEAESDVVAGYNVEYAGLLFGLFYLSEYLSLFSLCALLVSLLGGGWQLTPEWACAL